MDFIFPGRFSSSVKLATLAGAFGGLVYLGWWAEKHGYLNQSSEEGQQRRYAQGRGGEDENGVGDESSFVQSLSTFLDEVQTMIDNPRPVSTPQEIEQMFMVVARTYTQVKQFAELLSKITNPELQDQKEVCYLKIQKLVHSLETYRAGLIEKANLLARSNNTIEEEEEENGGSRVTEIVEKKRKEIKPAVAAAPASSGVFTLDDDEEEEEEEEEEETTTTNEGTEQNHIEQRRQQIILDDEEEEGHEEVDFEHPIDLRGDGSDIANYIMAALAAEMEQSKEEFIEEYEQHHEEEEENDEPRVQELAVD